MAVPRLVLVLSENWTLTPPRDLRALLQIAVDAERAGVDTVMLSEHVVLGRSSGAGGIMGNPRDYAAPGNQDPATPWPDSIVLASAIAAATQTIRIALAAIIAPLRHPLLLAKQLATLDLLAEGRLVVQPTVSWHRDEYDALGVPFGERGAILDEQLLAMRAAWTQTPASHPGLRFPFTEVYCEPKPFRADGPRMWFGGMALNAPIIRRLATYGHGFHPFGSPTPGELEQLDLALRERGRSLAEIEMIGGIRGTFAGTDDLADLAQACASIPGQLAQGYSSICFKPSMFTDDVAAVGDLCRDLVRQVATLS